MGQDDSKIGRILVGNRVILIHFWNRERFPSYSFGLGKMWDGFENANYLISV